MVHLDEPHGALDLVGGLFEGPAAVLGSVGDLDHRRAVETVVAVEEYWIVARIGQDGGGLIEEVGDAILGSLVFGAAVIDDGNMHPVDAQLGSELSLLDREMVVGGM